MRRGRIRCAVGCALVSCALMITLVVAPRLQTVVLNGNLGVSDATPAAVPADVHP